MVVLKKNSNIPASKTKTKRKNNTLLKVAGGIAGLALLAAPLVMGLAGVVEAGGGGAAAALEAGAEGGTGALEAANDVPLSRTPVPPPRPFHPLLRYSNKYRSPLLEGSLPYAGPLPNTLSKMQELQGEEYTRFKSLKRQLHLHHLENPTTFERIERNTLVSPTQGNPLLNVPSNLITEHLKPPPIIPNIPIIGPITQEQHFEQQLAHFERYQLRHLEELFSDVPLLKKVDRMFDIYADNMTLASKQAMEENKYLDALFAEEFEENYLSHRDIRRGRQLMEELQIHQEPELLSKIRTLDKHLSKRCKSYCFAGAAGFSAAAGIALSISNSKRDRERKRGGQ